MHTAMLIGGGYNFLKVKKSELGGTLKLVFNRVKKTSRRKRLLLPHLLEPPVPKAIFGQHVFPDYRLDRSVYVRAFFSSDNIIFCSGRKRDTCGHASAGVRSYLAATALIQFYQTIITKFRKSSHPGSAFDYFIHGGTANNVIPDRGRGDGGVRT